MSTPKKIALFIWMIASIFYAYQYILRVMPSIMFEELLEQFNIDAAVFGQFSGMYYMGYSLTHIPLGILLDRIGPRKIMSFCILITVIGLLPIMYGGTWFLAVLGRMLVGIGSSAAILGTFKIIRITFPEKQFTTWLSFSVTIGLIGAIYGGGPVGYLVREFGYIQVTKVFSILGLILAALTFYIVPEIEPDKKSSVTGDLWEVFSNKKVMLICISSGLLVGPLEGFADVWGTQFFKIVYGYDAETAEYLPSMIFLGMCFGAPIIGMIAEKLRSYIGVTIAAGAIMLFIYIALLMEILNLGIATISLIVVGICSSYQVLGIYLVSIFVRKEILGLATSMTNMIVMIFGYAFHTTIGYVISNYGGTKSQEAFKMGISVVPSGIFIGIIGYFILSIITNKKRIKKVAE